MIKIIKSGNIKRKTCDTCGCEFSYKEEDIQHDDREFTNYVTNCRLFHYIPYVVCPCCEKKLVIGDLPR